MDVRLQIVCQLLLFLGHPGYKAGVSAVEDFTCVTKPRIDIGNEDTYIAAYLHGGNADELSFARKAFTYTGRYPYTWSEIPLQWNRSLETFTLAEGNQISILRLPATEEKTRTGAFYCNSMIAGNVYISIATVIMSKNADFLPTRVSQTVNRGDVVNLAVTATDPARHETRWRKDGGRVINDRNGDPYFDFNNATVSDAGIYETHLYLERSRGNQSFMRLIVRGCKRDEWNSPQCDAACPVCLNGGMCDDRSGDCICPPGFSGQFCEILNGPNRFGQSGSFRCDSPELGGGSTCAGMLFCLPDPYGCSCAAGYQGIDCDETCSEGFYGANCEQSCHCTDGVTCNRTTGECSGNCAPGFTGINCQDKCLPFMGNMASCTTTCSDFLDPVMESFAPRTVTTLSPSQNESVRTIRWSPVHCPSGGVVANYVYRFGLLSASQRGPEAAVRTEGSQVSLHPPQLCGTRYAFEVAAETTKGIGMFSYKHTFASGWRVPDAVGGLTVQNTKYDRVRLSWAAPGTSQEYPCLASDYLVTFDLTNLEQCQEVLQHGGSVTTGDTSVTLHRLKAYSTYTVSVTPRNEAGNGTAASLQITTEQTAPLVPPEFSSSSVTTDSITLTWNVIPCGSRGGNITGYRTRLMGTDFTIKTKRAALLTTSVTHTGLEPCTNYTLDVWAYNNAGPSRWLKHYQLTESVVPDAVSDISIQHAFSRKRNQFDVRWTSPDGACPATSYNVTHELIGMELRCMQNRAIVTDVGTVDTTRIAVHLPVYYSKYRVHVTPVNEAGHGETNFQDIYTSENTPTAAPLIQSTASNGSVTFSWDPISCGSRRGNITHYEYIFEGPGSRGAYIPSERRNTSEMSVTFRGLLTCTTYSIRVRGYTRLGAGPWTNQAFQETIRTDEILSLNLETSQNSIQVTWETTEEETSSCPVTSYRVSYQLLNLEQCQPRAERPAPIHAQVVNGSGTNLTSMHAYSTYSVHVQPVYGAGEEFLKRKTVTTDEEVPLAAPEVDSVSSTNSITRVSWHPIPCGKRGGNIRGYTYELRARGASGAVVETGDTAAEYVEVETLSQGVYLFKLRAFTRVGPGPWLEINVVEIQVDQGVHKTTGICVTNPVYIGIGAAIGILHSIAVALLIVCVRRTNHRKRSPKAKRSASRSSSETRAPGDTDDIYCNINDMELIKISAKPSGASPTGASTASPRKSSSKRSSTKHWATKQSKMAADQIAHTYECSLVP